jgi:hypothetical protein
LSDFEIRTEKEDLKEKKHENKPGKKEPYEDRNTTGRECLSHAEGEADIGWRVHGV